jgi:hypothetical protein
MTVLGDFALQDLHTRLQPLLIFTIDGANYLDVADPKWEIVAAVSHAEGKQQQLVSGPVVFTCSGCLSYARSLRRLVMKHRSH